MHSSLVSHGLGCLAHPTLAELMPLNGRDHHTNIYVVGQEGLILLLSVDSIYMSLPQCLPIAIQLLAPAAVGLRPRVSLPNIVGVP